MSQASDNPQGRKSRKKDAGLWGFKAGVVVWVYGVRRLCAQGTSQSIVFGAVDEVVTHRDSLEVGLEACSGSTKPSPVEGRRCIGVSRVERGNGSRRVASTVWWRVRDMSGVEDVDDAHGHAASGAHQPLGG